MFRSLLPTGRRTVSRFDDPFIALQRNMNRLFDDAFIGWPAPKSGNGADVLAPSIDVKETDKAVEIEAELPGVDEKDVQVTYAGGILTIKGEKKDQKEVTKGDYHISERNFGSFFRSLTIDDVDSDKIEATFAKGVLKLTLPKAAAAQAKAKTITIKTSK